MILHKVLQLKLIFIHLFILCIYVFCLHKSFVTRSEDGGGSDGHDPLPLVDGVKKLSHLATRVRYLF